MKIYIDRDMSSEYDATDLYEDSPNLVEADVTNEFWKKYNRVQREYWDIQDKLHALFEAGKSTWGDKK